MSRLRHASHTFSHVRSAGRLSLNLTRTHTIMASAGPDKLETAGSGTHPSENLVLDIPLSVEKDRPLPVKHVYVVS